MTEAITAEARLRARNQITVPAMVVDLLGAQHDDLLIFEANEHEPGTAVVRAVSPLVAGALTGIYGTTEDVKAFLQQEHADWNC